MLSPTDEVTERQLEKGLTALARDGLWAQVVGALTSGVLLTAFALELGPSNFVIGCLASAPFFMQFAQMPAILLVEHLRKRKLSAVAALSASRFLLLPIALMPFFLTQTLTQDLLIAGVGLGAACGWNSWIRDLVPGKRVGQFSARRLVLATGWSMIAGLAGGAFIEILERWDAAPPTVVADSILFVLGLVACTG